MSVAIIGAGVAGLCVAYRLSAIHGLKVTVYADKDASCASKYALGFSQIKGDRAARDPLFKLKQKGHKNLRQLVSVLGKESLGFVSGIYEPFQGVTDYHKVFSRVYDGNFFSPYQNKLLKNPISNELPMIKKAWFYPDDFCFSAEKFLHRLHEECCNQGVVFVDDQIKKFVQETVGVKLFGASGQICLYSDCILAAGVGCFELIRNSGFEVPYYRLKNGTRIQRLKKTTQKIGLTYLNSSVYCDTNKSYLVAEDDSQKQILSDFVDYTLEVSNVLELHSAQRVRGKGMLPYLTLVSRGAEGSSVLLLSGLYKNGYQFSDIAAQTIQQWMAPNNTLRKLKERPSLSLQQNYFFDDLPR